MFGIGKKHDNEESDATVQESLEQNNSVEGVSPPDVELQPNDAETQSISEGSFVIKNRPSEIATRVIQEVDISELVQKYPLLESISNLNKLKSPLLIISERAERGIKEHISWGKNTKQNVCEQGGILIGRPFLTGDSILGLVEYVIPAEVSHASSAYLKMGTETWVKMLDIYDEQYKEDGLYIIGWFHTHPNNLSVFMSSTDMGTQRAFFNQDWHFSIVLNPHRHLIACFNSTKADKCDFYPTNFVER